MTIYGLVVYALAWVFLIVGLSFLGRILMLILLMIVSPLAFVTAAVPKFRGMDVIGFDSWIKKLIEVSFSAVVFMFILYLVAEIVGAQVFSTTSVQTGQSLTGALVLLFLPAIMIVVLLRKGAKYAEEASGEFTKQILGGAKLLGGLAGGLAIGAATGGTALVGRAGVGKLAAKAASNEGLKQAGYTTDAEGNMVAKKGLGGYFARMALKTADYGSKASFDLRQTKLSKFASSKTGMDFQHASILGLGSKEGGYRGMQERSAEKLKKESELYKTTMTNDQVKDWSRKKALEYDTNKAEEMETARKLAGVTHLSEKQKQAFEENYEKKNGKRPEEYDSAEKLNAARMKAFKDSLGSSGFLGSISYEIMKKVTKDDSFVDKDNYKQSKEYRNWELEKEATMRSEKTKQGYYELNYEDKKKWLDYFDKSYEDLYKKAPTVESINENRSGLSSGFVDKHNYRNSHEYKDWENDKQDKLKSEKKKQGFDQFNDTAKKKWLDDFENNYEVLYKKAPTVESINERRLKNTKIAVGAVAGALTGGIAGGVVGAGALGSITGGAVNALEHASGIPGASKFIAGLDKQAKSTEKLNARIKELSEIIKKGKEVEFELFKKKSDGSVETDSSGKPIMHKESIFVKSSSGEVTDEIDQDKLEEAIEIKNVRLEEIKKKKDPNSLLERIKLSKEKSLLMSLRTAEEKLIDMTGRKEAASGGSKPSTPKP
jgi:hypothetical protein